MMTRHDQQSRFWQTALMLGSVASVLVLTTSLLSPRHGQADSRPKQIVIVPIQRSADIENLDKIEKSKFVEAEWQNPAGSLLPDDMVEPPNAEKVIEKMVVAAVTVPQPQLSSLPPINARPDSDKNLSAWQKNAVAVSDAVRQSGRPKIAVIIDDVGLSESRAHRVFRLPGPLTIAFLPYAEKLPSLAAEARHEGHELMVHVPMEAMDSAEDPGPGALRVNQSDAENLSRLSQSLQKFDGYVGINNHMGSRFTSDPDAITPILKMLKERGLLFVDSGTSPNSVGSDIADHIGLANAKRQIFLDHDQSLEAVRSSIAQLEQVARRQGMAIAIGHPHPTTMAVLEEWLPMAAQRGFDLVPVSFIVQSRGNQWRPQVAAMEP